MFLQSQTTNWHSWDFFWMKNGKIVLSESKDVVANDPLERAKKEVSECVCGRMDRTSSTTQASSMHFNLYLALGEEEQQQQQRQRGSTGDDSAHPAK